MSRIRELREQHGLQQKNLAIDLGVSQPTVSDWENGRKVPSAKSTAKLADYFGVSVDYLLGRDVPDDKKITPDEPELTEGEKEWIELFRQLSDDQRQMIRGMMRGIVNEINNER